jgi:hypothetical protein
MPEYSKLKYAPLRHMYCGIQKELHTHTGKASNHENQPPYLALFLRRSDHNIIRHFLHIRSQVASGTYTCTGFCLLRERILHSRRELGVISRVPLVIYLRLASALSEVDWTQLTGSRTRPHVSARTAKPGSAVNFYASAAKHLVPLPLRKG